jgi:hypothetical protein
MEGCQLDKCTIKVGVKLSSGKAEVRNRGKQQAGKYIPVTCPSNMPIIFIMLPILVPGRHGEALEGGISAENGAT